MHSLFKPGDIVKLPNTDLCKDESTVISVCSTYVVVTNKSGNTGWYNKSKIKDYEKVSSQ